MKFEEIKVGDRIRATLARDTYMNNRVITRGDTINFLVKHIPENKFQVPKLKVLFDGAYFWEYVYDFNFSDYDYEL